MNYLLKNLKLKKYGISKGFYAGNNRRHPGSGYIDFHSNNLVIISSRGVLGYSSNFEGELFFKQIKNNTDQFINIKQYEKDRLFSLEDLTIIKDKIYLSYTEEIKKNCWNTSVISGNINYENILFKKLFSSNDCVHSIDNIDKQFGASQAGGRIVKFFDDYIFYFFVFA